MPEENIQLGQGNTTNIRDSRGTQVGDNNTQINNFIINNPAPAVAPPSQSLKPLVIEPWVAAAYYDRTKLFPDITGEISRKQISTLFIVGDEYDWHDGLYDRLRKEIGILEDDGALFATVEWLNHAASEREYTYWIKMLEQLGERHLGDDVKEIQNKILKLISAQTKNRQQSRIIVHFKVDQPEWNKDDQGLLLKILEDWKAIHETLCASSSSKKAVHIGLIFSVVEEQSLSSRLKFWAKNDKNIEGYPTTQKLQPLLQDGFFQTLPLVSKRDVDDWVRVLRQRFDSEINDSSWWLEVKQHMVRQFENTAIMPHEKLKELVENDNNFIDALRYNKT